MKQKTAIILFSGGLDSTTCLYWAREQGYTCHTLTVGYGQKHGREVRSAREIATRLGVKQHEITLQLPWLAASSLVDNNQTIPNHPLAEITNGQIPSTYVPGRNLMFLSVAASLADGAESSPSMIIPASRAR